MIRLNLGCGDPNARSWHPMEGYVNLDPAYGGWHFQDGLPNHADDSVEAITISHALMYLPDTEWPAFMAECARVLCDTGVIRITEDHTTDTRSRTYPDGWKGSQPRQTLTHPEMVKEFLRGAGLLAVDCDPDQTNFVDRSIIQQQHGDPPDVFFCEGIRMTRALFSAHADDEALFSSFVVLKYRPRVIICYPSIPEYGDTAMRTDESRDAANVLGAESVEQWQGGGVDALLPLMRDYDASVRPSLVFAPNEATSHPDHRAVAVAARTIFGDRLRTFHTYDQNGKVRSEWPIEYEPAWVHAKLRALARFTSQATHPRAHQFFLWDKFEFWGEAP